MTNISRYQVMVVDINNNCNIRCIFCINDWTKTRKTTYMDYKTFSKVLELLPLVGRCFFSCAYEPTLHPNYIEFFKRVPKTKAYTFITTNLVKKFTQEEFEELSNMNLNSITISLSSFNPKVYEELHRGAKFDAFIDNLERLVAVFKQKPNAPKLRYITIVFKQNLDELIDIAQTCWEKYLSTMHQFRTPFPGTPRLEDKEWVEKSVVSEENYEIVSNKLAKLPYNILFFNPFYKSDIHIPINGTIRKVDRLTNTYFSFRADGEIVFHEYNKKRLPAEFQGNLNINNISKPYEFFKVGLQKIRKMETN